MERGAFSMKNGFGERDIERARNHDGSHWSLMLCGTLNTPHKAADSLRTK